MEPQANISYFQVLCNARENESYACSIADNIFLQVNLLRTVIASIIGCLVIINNIINLVILRKMTTINARVKALMASMSLSDLLLGIFGCVPGMVAGFLHYWPFSSVFCQITGVVSGMSVGVSMWSLTGITVERFMVIVQPIHFNHNPKLSHVKVAIVFIWIFNIAYFAFPMFLREDFVYYVYQPHMLVCGFVWDYKWLFYLAGVIYPSGPGLLIIVCSYKIIMVIRESNMKIIEMTSTDDASKAKSGKNKKKAWSASESKPHGSHLKRTVMKREAKVSKVMIITAAAFFICFIPYVTTNAIEVSDIPLSPWHSYGVMWLMNCNSFINVFIYSVSYAEFRQLFKAIFLPCCNGDEDAKNSYRCKK